MRAPENPGRRKGDEQRLWTLTYSQIAEWSGLAPRSVRAYASQGQYDPREIESVLCWVNARRQRQGLPLIGLPAHEVNAPPPTPPSGYNPETASFPDEE